MAGDARGLPRGRGRHRFRRRRPPRQGRSDAPGAHAPRPASLSPFDNALCAVWVSALGFPVADDYHAPTRTGVSSLRADDARRAARPRRTTRTSSRLRSRPNLSFEATCWSTVCSSMVGAWCGVRHPTGEAIEAARGPGERRRDPLPRDPAAIRHRPRRPPGRRGEPEGSCGDARVRDRARPRPADRPHTNEPLFTSDAALHVGLARRGTERHADAPFGAVGATEEAWWAVAPDRRRDACVLKRRDPLRSADPTGDPVVEFRMLSDDRDLVSLPRVRPAHDRHRASARSGTR